MSDRSVTELRSDEAFKALTRSYDDRLTALESRRTQGDIQLKSLVVNENVEATGQLQVGSTDGIVGVVVPIVTLLPTEPYDGQEILYLIPGTAKLWRLVYGGVGLEPYPWIFAGGSPLMSVVPDNEQDTTGPYNDLTHVGPTIAIPLNGSYNLAGGVYVNNSTSGGTQSAAPTWMPSGLQVGFTVIGSNPGANGASLFTLAAEAADVLLTGAPADLKMQYGTGGSSFYAQRWLRATPVRVGA